MNSRSLILRLLLLSALPLIAAVIYLRGQHYDPALIDFRSASETKSAGPAAAPPSATQTVPPSGTVPGAETISGLIKSGRERSYTKENLYEHVNGHAEYFISAGFEGLTVTDYIAAGSKSGEPEYRAEVFDMGSGLQAFGVLSEESGENPATVSAGSMGYKTSGGINFIKGRFYVKTTAFIKTPHLLKFATAVSGSLPAGRESLGVLSRLPDIGKTLKTRFIREGYRGLDFLRNVVEREYSTDRGKVTVAMLAGSKQDAPTVKTALFDYFRRSSMRHEKAERSGQEFYRITDRYEGNWLMVPSGDAIFGVFGTEDDAFVEYFKKR